MISKYENFLGTIIIIKQILIKSMVKLENFGL